MWTTYCKCISLSCVAFRGPQGGEGGSMFPCSQHNFPCVLVFPKSIFRWCSLFPKICFCSRVPSFIFILFPRSLKVNGHVPLNPKHPWEALFTALCDWSRKLTQPSQPIRCKTKTNRGLVTRVFPRLRPVTCIYFEFSLVLVIFPFVVIGRFDYWFWFYNTQSKSALRLNCFVR